MADRNNENDEERNFGLCELQYGQDIVKALEAIDLDAVDKEALFGTLKAIHSHLKNAMGSLK